MFDNEEWLQEKRREAKFWHDHYFVCCECGVKSRRKLTYGHPKKIGMVCLDCADQLWSPE